MIAGTHVLVYSEDAPATRAFFRDVLGFESVDAGDGWLIFDLPTAELGIHPGSPGHELLFMCHDIEATVDDLKAKGVEFVSPVSDEGFGTTARFKVPGSSEILLYEPKHASPLGEFADR
jgi:catechol 2,3-dioxygenase-like lactoylglutathione lyase family enzyme